MKTSRSFAGTQNLACLSTEFNQEWMLDNGSDVHVCTSLSAIKHGMDEDDKVCEDWKGISANADGIGLV
ncbi:hypothetical protein JG688_00015837 [Phytophthora aleatoria]|uniref:Uncharacterized protein n=1 Tax=Phytophthora aleatoria TaxID=2496075 RepID=A0A8J5MCS0_9STRA|nr:hypothetical protein JG688_00015837 [Phytophthora aleatoria]